MNQCFWFRQDLRLKDNEALRAASENKDGDLVALYIIAHETWQQHCWSNVKVDFILRQLEQLSDELEKLNIPLKIIKVKVFSEVPKKILSFCSQHKISSVYVNKQLLVDEMQRDAAVKDALAKKDIHFHEYDDATIMPPNDMLKNDGTPFKVFTPFKRQWMQRVTPGHFLASNKKPLKQKKLMTDVDAIPKTVAGFQRTVELAELWPVAETVAHKRLLKFYRERVSDYEQQRDFPAIDGTSLISPYLANGILSPRQCLTALCDELEVNTLSQVGKNKGAFCWLSEIIWREFYYDVAFLFPEVVKNHPFKEKTKKLHWSLSKKNFQAWCEGSTGFPLVDAAMRQLNQTGWMHNRLRMVVAMFLTKTLYINWRWGEDYFMRQLVDGDFASNNGGWQWSASTGTDAVPYFRIFNPTTQSERFDADGDFIRKYCPELSGCSAKEIHNPSKDLRESVNYPEPIVDYKLMRQKVIAAFKELS